MLFTAITILLRWAFPRMALPGVLGLALTIAIATEALQIFTEGHPSWADLARDGLGIVLAFPVYQLITPSRTISALGMSIIATLILPGIILASYIARDARLPVLYDASMWDRSILTTSNSAVSITSLPEWHELSGAAVTHIIWADKRWPGLHLSYPADDWSDYRNIVVEAYNPGAAQPLTVAVRYRGHEGTSAFKTSDLTPGANQLRVSLDELLEQPDGSRARVVLIILHTTQPYAGQAIYLDRVYLE